MFYLIPITILAYKHRVNIGYYLMKSYSYLEIQYYRWYNKYYMNPDNKLFINGEQIFDKGDIHSYRHSQIDGREQVYEIEYIYKNKIYRINGNDLEKLLNYLDKIDIYADSCVDNHKKIYKWISATDNDGNCYLELVKKYSGPLGDFYNHAEDIEIFYKYNVWLKDKTIKITDFRLDEYILDGTKLNNKIKLE